MDNSGDGTTDQPDQHPELDWDEISEPGCYLMVGSGLLARVHPDEVESIRNAVGGGAGARVAKLSANPREPLLVLRSLAARRHYIVKF